MRVLICEPNVRGHHLDYAAMTARAVLGVTDDVVLAVSGEAAGSFSYEQFVRPLEARVAVRRFELPGRRSEVRTYARLLNRLAHWAFLERSILAIRPDHVIVPSGDMILNTLAVMPKFVSTRAEIEVALHTSILGRPASRETVRGRLQRLLMPHASAVSRFHFVDPTQYWIARDRYPAMASRFRLLPHPESGFEPIAREDARRQLGVPTSGRLAALLSPDPRKAPWAALDVFKTNRAPRDCRLLILGRIHDSVDQRLRMELRDQVESGRILVLRGRTDERDLHHAVCAADLVVGRLRPVDGISAMCVKGVVAGRRFVAASNAWTDMMAACLDAADCCTPGTPDNFAAVFAAALDRARHPLDPEIVRRLALYHTHENFSTALTERLRERMGLRRGAGVAWNWVLRAGVRTRSARAFEVA